MRGTQRCTAPNIARRRSVRSRLRARGTACRKRRSGFHHLQFAHKSGRTSASRAGRPLCIRLDRRLRRPHRFFRMPRSARDRSQSSFRTHPPQRCCNRKSQGDSCRWRTHRSSTWEVRWPESTVSTRFRCSRSASPSPWGTSHHTAFAAHRTYRRRSEKRHRWALLPVSWATHWTRRRLLVLAACRRSSHR